MNCEVKIWEEKVTIPTYLVGTPDKNPMFLEKRVYQGSSGKVYPFPVIDKIYDEKVDREYTMIFLENQYLLIAILPELGGRIQRAYDKTNGYDFVYFNHVIKPALVGLAGPWISGGIEFNWPQHHRPSTFSPVEYLLQESEDGSSTVWVGEIDRMYGTKGMAGFTLYPDQAVLEVTGQLYNRTPQRQTFLWWANPAVAVNDHYKSIFPPDVHAVFDHGKRDVSKFPIATGQYYKVDYSAGVDISRYKNIPVPTSYMAYYSDFDFVGGYDFAKQAGILHVANHHIAPGKKQWTWGNGDFGKAWDRNLTDNDGPYVELMTGVYTDNQPDFSWLEPYETKTFTQYFLPYKQIGEVKNANENALLNLEIKQGTAELALYTTKSFKNLTIEFYHKDQLLFTDTVSLTPKTAYLKELLVDQDSETHLFNLRVLTEGGSELIAYQPRKPQLLETPKPAQPAAQPGEITSCEELFLTGIHLEQYRHATYRPEDYYKEGLRRHPQDSRINNAYGSLLLRNGAIEESEKYFRASIKTLTSRNPNPYDGEPFYNLGLCLKLQGRDEEAFKAFFKATWNGAYRSSGYFELAQIAAKNGRYLQGIAFLDNAILANYQNMKARNLKTALLRKLGNLEQALRLARESIQLDPLDFAVRNELVMLYQLVQENQQSEDNLELLLKLMRDESHNYLELSEEYAQAGLFEEAVAVLKRFLSQNIESEGVSPLVYYYLGYYYRQLGNKQEQVNYYQLGANAKTDYCFPNKLYTILVLEDAIHSNPKDAKALYYLGNLFYDKRQYARAISLWERSTKLDGKFATVHRNLALGYYNNHKDGQRARNSLETAFRLEQSDARVLFELDQLYKKLGVSPKERLARLEDNPALVDARDDLFLEYVTLLNLQAMFEKALKLLGSRKFHPWEGGEGKVTKQYVLCHTELAKQFLRAAKYQEAEKHLAAARVYPANLGEGKLAGAQEKDIKFFLGMAFQGMGNSSKAKTYWQDAASGIDEPANAMFYNDQPADQIYYQGLALLELNNEKMARSRFNKLYDYGEQHIFDQVRIDYFAVSLPDFLVFDEDLDKKNCIHCHYLMGLGCLGLGRYEEAKGHFSNALMLDPAHQGAILHLEAANKHRKW